MNILECSKNLLTYFAPEERSIPDNVSYPGRNAAVLKAINEALQDLYGKGGQWVRNDDRAVVLNAPATVPITVTKGSRSATISTAVWRDWFLGCSIAIEGSEVDNQVRGAVISEDEYPAGSILLEGVISSRLGDLGDYDFPPQLVLRYDGNDSSGFPEYSYEGPVYNLTLNRDSDTSGPVWYLSSNTEAEGFLKNYSAAASPIGLTEWEPNDGLYGNPSLSLFTGHYDVRLKFPYSGESGTVNATVYHDSLSIDTDVLEVHEPVRIDRRRLGPVTSSKAGGVRRILEDFGMCGERHVDGDRRVGETAGMPRFFAVETWSPSDSAAPQIRIYLTPAPLTEGFLDHGAMLCPPAITSIASESNLPVPFSFVESIFLPIALKKLRGCPFWRGIVGDDEVNAGYANALKLLDEGNPQRRTGISFKSKF